MYKYFHPSKGRGQWISGILVGACGFVSGLGLVWASVLFPKVSYGEVKLELTNLDKTLIANFLNIGQLVGVFPVSFLQDKYGRKASLTFAINLQMTAWVLIFLFQEIWALLTARLLMGIWVSFVITCVPPYICETAAAHFRGRIAASLTILALTSSFYQTLMGTFLSYHTVALVSGLITFAQFVSLINLPESVYSLLQRHKDIQAEKVLRWLRGVDDVSEEMLQIQTSLNIQMARKSGFKDIFQFSSSKKGFFMASTLLFVQRFNIFQIMLSFSSTVIPNCFIEPAHFSYIWTGISILFLTISVSCSDHVNRRTLLFISTIGHTTCCVITSIWFYLYEKTKIDMSSTLWLPLVSLSFDTAFYAVGLLYIPLIFQAEIFPINVKAKACSLNAFIAFVAALLIVTMFVPIRVTIGLYGNFLVYAIVSLIGVFVTYNIVETRAKTLEEIQNILERKSD